MKSRLSRILLLCLLFPAAAAAAETPACQVRVDDPDVSFPFEKLDRAALCRAAPIINEHTTHRIMPSFSTPVSKPMYDFMLDHMVLSSALARGLGLAKYRIAHAGTDSFQGDDGDGSEGLITLLYRDPGRRVYHMQGGHHGKVIPLITGEAIILIENRAKDGEQGRGEIETRITTYSKIDNSVIAALVKVFQPLLRSVVNDKLAQGFLVVHQLGERMAADPEEVYRQAEAIPEADKADIEALKALLKPRP